MNGRTLLVLVSTPDKLQFHSPNLSLAPGSGDKEGSKDRRRDAQTEVRTEEWYLAGWTRKEVSLQERLPLPSELTRVNGGSDVHVNEDFT